MLLPFCCPVAIVLSFVGAFLALFGDLITVRKLSFTGANFVGIALALLLAILSAAYFVFLGTIERNTPLICTLWWINVIGTLGSVPFSLAFEDWCACA